MGLKTTFSRSEGLEEVDQKLYSLVRARLLIVLYMPFCGNELQFKEDRPPSRKLTDVSCCLDGFP